MCITFIYIYIYTLYYNVEKKSHSSPCFISEKKESFHLQPRISGWSLRIRTKFSASVRMPLAMRWHLLCLSTRCWSPSETIQMPWLRPPLKPPISWRHSRWFGPVRKFRQARKTRYSAFGISSYNWQKRRGPNKKWGLKQLEKIFKFAEKK